MKKNKTFKIGELCRLFNISADSIRYYEKTGILHPTRNPENNYRCYSIEDFRRIALIRELLRLGFSTQQIREFLTDRSVQKTTAMMLAALSDIDKEIHRLKSIRDNLSSRLDSIHAILERYDPEEKIRELLLPGRKCIMVSNADIPDNQIDYYRIQYINQTNNYVGTVGICDCCTLDITEPDPDHNSYKSKNVFFYSESFCTSHYNYFLPEGLYLSILYKGHLTKTRELVLALYAYAGQHQYRPAGDPIEFRYIDEYETASENEYLIEIQLPVARI